VIDREFIRRLSVKWQTSETNVAREYLQHNFLRIFYQQKKSHQIFFKGGTALRLVFDSPRFSEDLDFSSLVTSVKTIEDLLGETLLQLSYQQISLDMTEAKSTSGGYLFYAKTILFDKEINLKLNFVIKKSAANQTETVKSIFMSPYSLVVLRTRELISEKVEAFLTRHKVRDYFDLYYVLRANLERNVILARRVEIIKVINSSKLNLGELKVFLPRTFLLLLKDLKNSLLRELR